MANALKVEMSYQKKNQTKKPPTFNRTLPSSGHVKDWISRVPLPECSPPSGNQANMASGPNGPLQAALEDSA